MTLNLKTFCVGALLCCLTFFTTSFAPSFRDDDSRALSCVVEVRNPDGSVAKYVEVTTSGAGGVYCEGGVLLRQMSMAKYPFIGLTFAELQLCI